MPSLMQSMVAKFGTISIVLTLVVFYSNCSAPKSDEGTDVLPGTSGSKVTSNCYVPHSPNAILTKNSLFAGSDWNDPSVLKIGGQYVMFASSDHSFDLNIEIYRMVSTNGVDWTLSPSTPVFTANPSATAWDHKATETPSVVYFKGQYHLFYTGYATSHLDSYGYKIGHAVSNDGISWTRDPSYILAPTNPSGAVNLDFNQFVVGEPGAVVFNDKIYLYFTAIGADIEVGSSLQTIGLTTSTDGTTWSAPQQVLKPSQSIYPRTNWLGYSTPSAIVLQGKMHLYYSVAQASPWKQLKIHHASSVDGLSGWSEDSSAIFSASDFSWTSEEILAPAAFLDGSTLMMWFAGHTPTVLGIGLARCNL